MLQELELYGDVFDVKEPVPAGLQSSELVLSESTFDPSSDAKRPMGWIELRTVRVHTKERVAGLTAPSAAERNIRETEVIR